MKDHGAENAPVQHIEERKVLDKSPGAQLVYPSKKEWDFRVLSKSFKL